MSDRPASSRPTAASPVTTALAQGPCPDLPTLTSRYLVEFLDKIEIMVEDLDEEQLWWRPVAEANSIANLHLHLAGNLRLWIAKGLGHDDFDRHRAEEFEADRTQTPAELQQTLRDAVERCTDVLATLDQPLDALVDIQGYRVDVMGVLLHVVEHMSYHTGQIATLAKQLRGARAFELYPQHAGE